MDKDFFREGSKLSSIRWTLVQVTRMCWLLISGAFLHICWYTYSFKPIDWLGILMLLGGLTGFLGAAVTGKWLQKKQEVKDANV